MNRIIVMVAILVLNMAVLTGTDAHASITNFSFGDTSIYWAPWWPSTDEDWGSGDDGRDVIGVPNFTGGSGIIEDGFLTEIQINWAGEGHSLLSPGDVFIDVGSDENWDYVITHDGLVYSTSFHISNPDYYYITNRDAPLLWNPSQYDVRNRHPVWFKPAVDQTSVGTATVNGTMNQVNGTIDYLNFVITDPAFGGVDLSSGYFTIGYTTTCANDTLYESQSPVPEPATFVLFGLGAAAFGAKFKKKKLI